MKAAELARRLKEPAPEPFLARDWSIALRAWLMNFHAIGGLAGERAIPLFGIAAVTEELEKQPDRDIPTERIVSAHKMLAFPWARAVISRMLYGPGEVTLKGIPAWYDRPAEKEGSVPSGDTPTR